ncbi:hypothetical protein D3C78_237130 [compost metagenome]
MLGGVRLWRSPEQKVAQHQLAELEKRHALLARSRSEAQAELISHEPEELRLAADLHRYHDLDPLEASATIAGLNEDLLRLHQSMKGTRSASEGTVIGLDALNALVPHLCEAYKVTLIFDPDIYARLSTDVFPQASVRVMGNDAKADEGLLAAAAYDGGPTSSAMTASPITPSSLRLKSAGC